LSEWRKVRAATEHGSRARFSPFQSKLRSNSKLEQQLIRLEALYRSSVALEAKRLPQLLPKGRTDLQANGRAYYWLTKVPQFTRAE
ncbi:MAG: hypothetical protein ACK5XI_10195, partial [Hyphomonadaceae bacterium]